MEAYEIIIISVCVLFVGYVIIKSVIDKKKGKCGCGDCENCKLACRNIRKKENVMKFLKCESCNAIVKEIVPCNCQGCGIKCCGKNMVEIPDPKIEGTGKILTCPSCGAKIEIIVPCNCPDCGFKCCGKNME